MLTSGISLWHKAVAGIGAGFNAYADYLLADDFDNSKYWQTDDNTGAGGTTESDVSQLAGYTFTAAGTCYELNSDGTIAGPFGPNVPAITDEGYKARQALTNLFLHSQEFDNAAWSKSNCTVAANNVTDPLGTTTADTLTTTASPAAITPSAGSTPVTANGAATVAVFVPAGGTAAHAYIQVNDGTSANASFITFNRTTGAVGISTNLVGSLPLTGYKKAVGTGWLFVINWTHSANANAVIYIGPCDAANDRAVTAGVTLPLWQAQAFNGATLPDGGPIIVTTTEPATRGEALLSHNIFADGSALTDQDMLIWAKGTVGEINAAAFHYALDLRIDANNRIGLYLDTTGVAFGQVVSGGATAYSQSAAGALSTGTEATLLLRRSGGNWRSGKYVGGTLTWGTEAAGAFPAGMTKANPGTYPTGANNFRGTIDSAFILPGTFSTDQSVIDAITGAP